MRDINVAWFAGIFEGEGCFSIERNGATRMTVGMTDRDIIERIHSLFPTTQAIATRQPKPRTPGGGTPKLLYTWRIGQPDEVRRITEMILPYLGERRSAKAREVLEHLATRPGVGGYQRAKKYCPNGHEYTAENTTYKGGAKCYRVCKECAKTWYTAQNAKVSERRKSERKMDPTCGRCEQPFRRVALSGRPPTYCPDCQILQRREVHARCVAKRRTRSNVE